MNLSLPENYKNASGEVQIIIKDRHGRVVEHRRHKNLIKIFAKEMLAHCLPHTKVWDPNANTGAGGWVANPVVKDDFSAKYILLGASYDDNTLLPLNTADTRYYSYDPVVGGYVPNRPNVGADNGGDLIHPIPIAEPNRPLKRIENVSFQASYQPADSPLLDGSVRALNNVAVFETTLKTSEYNGFGSSSADFFTITEVALAGGKELGSVGACDCPPQFLFLEGVGAAHDASILAIANGGATISIDGSVANIDVNRIVEGDQLMIVKAGGAAAVSGSALDDNYDTMGQVNPYYLVTSKAVGGRDITLDRTPTDAQGNPLTGNIGIYRSTLRLFSQRILDVPFKKDSSFEITIKWLIFFN
jgi:hypothetical protein